MPVGQRINAKEYDKMCPKKNKVPVSQQGDSLHVVISPDGSTHIAHVESEYTFAFELRNTARVMLKSAKLPNDGPYSHWELKAFIHGAIILSYAALEAAFNEVIHLHALM